MSASVGSREKYVTRWIGSTSRYRRRAAGSISDHLLLAEESPRGRPLTPATNYPAPIRPRLADYLQAASHGLSGLVSKVQAGAVRARSRVMLPRKRRISPGRLDRPARAGSRRLHLLGLARRCPAPLRPGARPPARLARDGSRRGRGRRTSG